MFEVNGSGVGIVFDWTIETVRVTLAVTGPSSCPRFWTHASFNANTINVYPRTQ